MKILQLLLLILGNIRTTLILLLVVSTALAWATFLENDYGTTAAQLWIYKTWWFELILALLLVNFLLNIARYKLLKKGKRAIFCFHIAFVFILIGAFITRHISFEGLLHLREGESKDYIQTQEQFLEASWIADNKDTLHFSYPLLLSQEVKQHFSFREQTQAETFTIEYLDYYESPTYTIKETVNGKDYALLELMLNGQSFTTALEEFSSEELESIQIGFNQSVWGIHIFRQGKQMWVQFPFDILRRNKHTQIDELLPPYTATLLGKDFYYLFDGIRLTYNGLVRGEKIYHKGKKKTQGKNLLRLLVSFKEQQQIVELWHRQYTTPQIQETVFGNHRLRLSYGSHQHKLPFRVTLQQFVLERNLGSNTPSAYRSHLLLEDEQGQQTGILSTNQVIDKKGYRLFQTSYDQDEQGTILTVNHDRWGTYITYFGYILMMVSMFFALFSSQSRFRQLAKKLHHIHNKKTLLLILCLSPIATLQVQSAQTEDTLYLGAQIIDPQHADRAGELLVIQDHQGRLQPFETFSNSILRKLYKKSTFHDLSANQVLLGATTSPDLWAGIALIKESNTELLKILKVENSTLSYNDCFDSSGRYLLSQLLHTGMLKKAAERNKLEQAVIKLDEKVNILYHIFNGHCIKLFPVPDDPTYWEYFGSKAKSPLQTQDSIFIHRIPQLYAQAVQEAYQTGNWEKADKIIVLISQYQEKEGAEVLPSKDQLIWEVRHQRLGLFQKLFPTYFTLGFLLLFVLFLQIFSPKKIFRRLALILSYFIFATFLAHTFALGLRWYIGGHAPWSNGYESMITVAWFTLFAAFLFARKSMITIALSTVMAGFLLLGAHFSWMDPEITPLVPVLQSHWLIFHVIVIIAGYGFLLMGALLALFALIITCFLNANNKSKLSLIIDEVTCINEMALTIGLYLLAIGSFIGGIWANESWGRYWGWDAKETWSLISIFVYTFVLHLRLIPALRARILYNILSLLAFSSIIMTYFGVNYYLSGLHAYAQGDSMATPRSIYIALALLSLLCVVAYNVEKKSK